MLKLIIGIILLLIPFLFSYKFKEKGSWYVLFLLIIFHLITALITQFFGIFNYWIILGINLILCVIVVYKADFMKFKKWIKNKKIDWIFIIVLIILFIQFFSVHNNYTGEISTINENFIGVSNMDYDYPYYSDEWVSVSFIKYSINSGKLPIVDPFFKKGFFPNLEMGFHSFSSEIFLFIDLDPLNDYTNMSIFFSLLICSLIYFILRTNNLSRPISAITTLSIPYIVNAGNLPGLWHYMPFTLGILFLLFGIFFMSKKDYLFSLYAGILTFLIYPPLSIIYFFSFITFVLFSDIKKKNKIKYIGLYIISNTLIVVLFFIIIVFVRGSFPLAIDYILSKLFYTSFTPNALIKLPILKIIPIWSLGLFIFSFKYIKKKLWLFVPVFIGLIYWIIYSGVLWRFIIEYQRIVVCTSILIVILSGFGLNYIVNYIKRFDFFNDKDFLKFLFILIIAVFLIFSFNYTERDNWKDLQLESIHDEEVYLPYPPANKFLISEDLRVFSKIKQKRFISPPWKGLVIGTATNNYPLDTKPSIVTENLASYKKFIRSDCAEKTNYSKKNKIDYVYSKKFDCNGFKLIDKNEKEDLFLYKVNLKN